MKKLITAFRTFITLHIIAIHPDERYDSSTVQDFVKFCWDTRQELLAAKTPAELEAAWWEVAWLEETFFKKVSEQTMMNEMAGLHHIYSSQRADMYAHKVF